MSFTQWFVILVAVVVIITDLVLYLKKGDDATISRMLLKTSQSWPIIPLLAGIILGHIFWTNCGTHAAPQDVHRVAKPHFRH
jgi:hypothetical protein